MTKYPALGHNAVPLVRFETATPRSRAESRVKHSTEPPCTARIYADQEIFVRVGPGPFDKVQLNLQSGCLNVSRGGVAIMIFQGMGRSGH